MGILDAISGRSRKYNAAVDSIIRNHIKIETNSSKNPRWLPGYLKEIEPFRRANSSPFVPAIAIGLSYLVDGIKYIEVNIEYISKNELSKINDELIVIGTNLRTLIDGSEHQNVIGEASRQSFSDLLDKVASFGLRDGTPESQMEK